jgi:hypothetical protein
VPADEPRRTFQARVRRTLTARIGLREAVGSMSPRDRASCYDVHARVGDMEPVTMAAALES